MAKIVAQLIAVEASSGAWVAIRATHDCDYFRIWNISGGWGGFASANVRLRTDPLDDQTEIPLNNGAMEVVDASAGTRHRFITNEILYYARSAGDATAVMLTCID